MFKFENSAKNGKIRGFSKFSQKRRYRFFSFFLIKFWKTSIFTIFGTFFKIYVFGHNSRRRTFLNMRFSTEWAHYKAFTWHKKPEWFYDTNGRNIWKIVGKCKFGPVWEPHFGPQFSGWRSDDSLNLTWAFRKYCLWSLWKSNRISVCSFHSWDIRIWKTGPKFPIAIWRTVQSDWSIPF